VWQDARGRVWLTYNDPDVLQQQHLTKVLTAVETLAAEAGE
jgi:hypothetical protein